MANSPPSGASYSRVHSWEWWLCSSRFGLLSLLVRIPFFRIPMLADERVRMGHAQLGQSQRETLRRTLDQPSPRASSILRRDLRHLWHRNRRLRFAAWIAIALTLLAIWAYARMYAGRSPRSFSAAVFAVASASPNLEGYFANAEMFKGFPAALAAAWLLFGVRHGLKRWHLVAIGVLLGIAISLKPSGAVMIPVTAAFLILPASEGERRRALQQNGLDPDWGCLSGSPR